MSNQDNYQNSYNSGQSDGSIMGSLGAMDKQFWDEKNKESQKNMYSRPQARSSSGSVSLGGVSQGRVSPSSHRVTKAPADPEAFEKGVATITMWGVFGYSIYYGLAILHIGVLFTLIGAVALSASAYYLLTGPFFFLLRALRYLLLIGIIGAAIVGALMVGYSIYQSSGEASTEAPSALETAATTSE